MADLQAALHAELRACLAASRLSQAEVARRAGISKKHLCQVLLDQAVISLPMAQRVAEACGRELLIKSRRKRKETPRGAVGGSPPAPPVGRADTADRAPRAATDAPTRNTSHTPHTRNQDS